jgi:hypothetical protein
VRIELDRIEREQLELERIEHERKEAKCEAKRRYAETRDSAE